MKEPMSAFEIEAERQAESAARIAAQRAARLAAGIVSQPARPKPEAATTSWVNDVREIIERNGVRHFTLADLEEYHDELADKHPHATDIAAAVRAALQKLRGLGEVCFVDNAGSYIYLAFESRDAKRV